MSMAEPRRRKKWTLNPRGSLWANDDTKFGQKLMEKMGWSKGSGLGREEQGMTEHLSVKLKDDSRGIGYKGNDDEWIKHYEEFENVLANLNSQENSTVNGKNDSTSDTTGLPDNSNIVKTSLETSSKASRVRVHYHKFTRSKDLSRLTEDDLGCILGSKRAKQLAKEKKLVETEDVVNDVDDIGHVDHSNGVTTIKGCSMQEYFAQKMEALKNRAKSQPQTLVEDNQWGGEEEDMGRPGFGMSCGGDELTPDSLDDGEDKREERKKKKKKRKKHQIEEEEINSVGTESEKCCIEAEENNIPKKKNKKKSPENSDLNGNTCEDGAVEPSNEDTSEAKPVVNERKKKKKKKKHFSAAVEEQTLSVVTEEHAVKKKKKRKYTDATNESNPSQDLIVEENPEKKKKKKKWKAKE